MLGSDGRSGLAHPLLRRRQGAADLHPHRWESGGKSNGPCRWLDLCGLCTHQSRFVHDQNPRKVAIPCACSRLRHCRAWRFIGFRNSGNAPHGALELTREMSLFRRRTDRMLKGLGSSNPLLSTIQSVSFRTSRRIARNPRVCARFSIAHGPACGSRLPDNQAKRLDADPHSFSVLNPSRRVQERSCPH